MINQAVEFLIIGPIVVSVGIVMFQVAKNRTLAGLESSFVALGGIIMFAFLVATILVFAKAFSFFSLLDGEESKEITIGNVSMSCEEIMEDNTEVEGVDKETVALYQKLKDSNVSQDEIEKVFSAVFSADELKTLERNAAKFQDSTKLDRMIRDHCEENVK